jgi:hypothetical protein
MKRVVALGTWGRLLVGMVYVPMPDAFRSFRQALVADAVLRRTSFMPISPPKQGTDLEITSLHVLSSNTRDERTPLRTHLGPNSIFSNCTNPGP